MNFGSVVNAGLDFASAEYFRDKQSDEATTSREFGRENQLMSQQFNAEEAAKNRQFQQWARSTQYQAMVSDMQAAGLNPALAYGHSPTAMSGSQASAGMAGAAVASGGTPPRISESLQSAAQIGVLNASKEKIEAEAAEVRARTPVHAASIQKIAQDVAESVERMKTYAPQASHSASGAALNLQQVQNLQAELPRIKVSIDQIRTLAHLNEAQIAGIAQGIHKSQAEVQEIMQRVKENIPQLDAMVKEMEFLLKQALVNPAQRQSEISGAPVLGHVQALIRGLFPLLQLVK